MREVIKTAVSMYGEFWGMGLYLILFLLAILYLLTMEKNKEKQKLFLGQIFIFALIYLFPVTAYVIMKYCIGESVYWRMFWLLPVTALIAYMYTEMVFHTDRRLKKGVAVIFILGILAATGNWVYGSGNFTVSPNPYKINQDVLVVCNAIEADAQANAISQKGVIVPNTLATGIRQYDAGISMPYGRNAIRGEKLSKVSQKIYDIMNAENLDAQALAFYAAKGGYNYLAYPTEESADAIIAAGYTRVADVGNYDIYRLDTDAVADTDWLITEYGSTENQMMFYTMQDMDGHVIVVDGGWVQNADTVRKVIAGLGNHVDAWILTHPHEDHIGAFCEIYDSPGKIKIDAIYAVDMASPELCMENAPWDSVEMYQRFLSMNIPQLEYVHSGDKLDVGNLKIDILSAYEDKVDELSNDLLNDGSMMFQVHGSSQTMLFCADVGKSMSEYLVETYGETLKSDYIQMGHHGNGGLKAPFYTIVDPKEAFFDAPDWLFNDTTGKYTTPENRALMESFGSSIVSFATAPNSILLK